MTTAAGVQSSDAAADLPPRPTEGDAPARPDPRQGDGYRAALGWWQPDHERPAAFATASDAAADEATPWEEPPALQAPAGETALSGRVLRVDGLPLPGVTLSLG